MKHQKQSGVAVVTALLLTTLAITIVASLFWQQQVQVRSIENQRFQMQKKWVLRGALDWAGLILREDRRISKVDHLGEPWAVSLGDTRLDQYVENGRTEVEDSDATLSGQISDAQAKYNLNNLAVNGRVDPRELAVFAKLLSNLRLDSSLAQQVAVQVALTQERVVVGPSKPDGTEGVENPVQPKNPGDAANGGAGAGANGGANTTPDGSGSAVGVPTGSNSTVQFLKFSQIEDLLSVPGFTSATIMRLRNFVTVLPDWTAINVNTTTAEVLSARLPQVSMTDAALMIATRDRAHFLNLENFKLNFPDKLKDVDPKHLDFSSSYFVVNGRVKLNRSLLEVDALFKRDDKGTQVLWVKEN
ncbi:type II secretion system minor pseudopilin GspK [Undibacterium seohonense]|uniref:Type II secretion system protein K n=1 Tax=Undibacterium seohonense TaxID=1344950 RepID=A0ABR6WZE9_9BURK|nr:type II secretion system minor pseudopilin GspK [Undibacterium seohonense]MBC3805917.1 type II secretion system minor pseudopilin GspK [Undibacterium seohonense]